MDYQSLKYVCDNTGSSFNPVLSNLFVYTDDKGQQRAQAQNGRYTVDVPTDLPSLCANADRMVSVWAACKGEPKVSATPSTLTVTQGRLRARVTLADGATYPRDTPDPETAHKALDLRPVLLGLQPFVATDASRPWAVSVCLAGTHAYATNNVVLARCPIDTGLPRPMNVPLGAVEALLAQTAALAGLGFGENSLTFYFEGGVWIKSLLVAGDWPTATVDNLLAAVGDQWLTIHDELESMLVVASKLADARHPVVVFKDGGMVLEDDSLLAADLEPVPAAGKVNARVAAMVFSSAKEVQWHTPRQDVHAFRAGPVVGVFGGQR